MNRVFSSASALLCATTASLFLLAGCHVTFSDGSIDIGLGFSEKAVREETRELTIATGQKFTVEITHGDFRLHTSSSGAPTLHAKITSHGATKDAAQHAVDAAQLKIESTSDGVVVRIDDAVSGHDSESGAVHSTSRVDLDIQLPPGVQLALSTESGEIEAAGPFASSDLRSSYGKVNVSTVEGDLMIHSGSGSLEASGVHGGRVEAVTSYGSVKLSSSEVKTAICKSSSGSVRVEDVKAEHIDVQSSYGSAELDRIKGDLDVKLSSGGIRIEDLSGAHHNLKSNYGGIRIERAKGDTQVDTSSGSIKISDFEGRLEARSGYGSVDIEGVLFALVAESSSGTVDVRAERGSKVESAWKLHSNYGAVKLGLPPGLGCELAAKTNYGEIDVGLPIELQAGGLKPGKSVHGKIGGGGGLISLDSSSGSVNIYPLD